MVTAGTVVVVAETKSPTQKKGASYGTLFYFAVNDAAGGEKVPGTFSPSPQCGAGISWPV